MTTPKITIVFPTFKRPEEARRTVALLRRNISVPYELFVVDNSPTPTDLELQTNEHAVFVGRNAGTGARNMGVLRASAPYVMMLDDDSHPLPGTVERAVQQLNRASQTVAGIIGAIEDGYGERSASLLPTVFHGCGVVFRRDLLRQFGGGYPVDFGFYGEEYWVTMLIYQAGYALLPDDRVRICHRLSATERDHSRIFYYLGRNNAQIWRRFVPSEHVHQILYDTARRYELLARKERQQEAYRRGVAESRLRPPPRTPLAADQFRQVALLPSLDRVAAAHRGKQLVLCESGKFPSFWADRLRSQNVREVFIADSNPGLIGHRFGDYGIIPPERAMALAAAGATLVLGHGSPARTQSWDAMARDRGLPQHRIWRIDPGKDIAAWSHSQPQQPELNQAAGA